MTHGSMRVAAGLAALAVALHTGNAAAQPQDSGEVSAARKLGQDGIILAQQGRCPEAVDMLGRAVALVPAPSLLVPLGECQIKLGQYVAGTESLQAALREPLPKNPPKAFVDARKRAEQILPDALTRIAKITVVIQAPAGTKVSLKDNNVPVSEVLIGVERPADPGRHVLDVTAPGFHAERREVNLSSGRGETVRIALRVDPRAPKAGGISPTAPGGRRDQGPSGLVIGGAVVAGVGGAGVILGAVFGGLTLSKQSSLDEVCSADKACPEGSQGDIDELTTFSHVSTASFVVGGVGLAAGAVLLGLGLSQAPSREASLRPLIGPGYVGLEGSF